MYNEDLSKSPASYDWLQKCPHLKALAIHEAPDCHSLWNPVLKTKASATLVLGRIATLHMNPKLDSPFPVMPFAQLREFLSVMPALTTLSLILVGVDRGVRPNSAGTTSPRESLPPFKLEHFLLKANTNMMHADFAWLLSASKDTLRVFEIEMLSGLFPPYPHRCFRDRFRPNGRTICRYR